MKKLITILVTTACIFSFVGMASAATIDFQDLNDGDTVYQQYSSDGITFSDSLITLSSTSVVATNALGNNYLFQSNFASGFYLLFDTPIYSFSANVYEIPPEPEEYPAPEEAPEEEPEEEPEEYPGAGDSVYLNIYGDDGSGLFNQLNNIDIVVHSSNMWSQINYFGDSPITAIQLSGTMNFYGDNINTDTTPVPLPASILLFGTGLAGLVGIGIRRNKKA